MQLLHTLLGIKIKYIQTQRKTTKAKAVLDEINLSSMFSNEYVLSAFWKTAIFNGNFEVLLIFLWNRILNFDKSNPVRLENIKISN